MKNSNPNFYKIAHCCECQSQDGLFQHKYNDRIICCGCVDEINKEFKRISLERESEINIGSLTELLQERAE